MQVLQYRPRMVLGRVTYATRSVRGVVDRARGRTPSPAIHLVRAAGRWPDRVVVTDDDGAATLRELCEGVRELAGALHARGIGPGSTVGLLCRRHVGLVEAAFATIWLGADATLLEPGADDVLVRQPSLDLLLRDAVAGPPVAHTSTGVATLVIGAHGSGSVTAVRSFGHPAPPPRRTATVSTSLDDVLTAIALGRPVDLSSS